MAARRRAGRPTTPPKEGEKATLGIRASADLKQRLDLAAKRNGRSLSQEAEHRLEESLRDELGQMLELAYGRPLAGLLMMIGHAMQLVGKRAAFEATHSYDAIDRWPTNPYAFDQAVNAAAAVLEGMRPPGNRELPQRVATTIPTDFGRIMGGLTLSFVKDPETARTNESVELEIFARKVNAMLGPLASEITVPDLRTDAPGDQAQ
jgi:hypothetical protein